MLVGTRWSWAALNFYVTWGKVCKEFNNSRKEFVFTEQATDGVQGGDAYNVRYSNESRIYYL